MPTLSEALAIAVQHHQAGQLHSAEQIYRQILAADPNQANALHLLGIIASQMGQHDAAVEYISRAIRVDGTDASFHGNLANALKAQGKLDQAIAAYRRAIELKPNYAIVHFNLGVAFQELGSFDEAVACFQQALELNPSDAEAQQKLALAFNNLGTAFQAQGKREHAIECFRRAVQLKPDLAEAHTNLGNSLQELRRFDEAIARHRRALELDPNNSEVHSNLGTALQAQGKLDDAVTCFRRALELKPNLSPAHNNLGSAFLALGKLDEALVCFHRAVELNPDDAKTLSNLGNALQRLRRLDNALAAYDRALAATADCPYAHFGRATLHLLQGNLESGWREYEWRWKTNDLIRRDFSVPKWDGNPLQERTILLHAEQGLGDTIQLVRYAALVKMQNPKAKLIMECQRPLAKLLATCPGFDRLVVQGDDLPPFDVYAPLLSVPGILNTSLATIPAEIPYLFADPALVDQWRERLASEPGFRIGISWRGRPTTRHRDIPLECFRFLTELPGVTVISLQKGEARTELSAVGGNGTSIVDLGDDFDTAHGAFMDTAAIMKTLDLVITSDTAVPHLAGALGVPVWLALPFVPDWRWLLDRTDSPWYSTMRLFRQKSPGDWPSVFNEIQTALRQRFSSPTTAT